MLVLKNIIIKINNLSDGFIGRTDKIEKIVNEFDRVLLEII